MADVPEEAVDAALAADQERSREAREIVFLSPGRDQVRVMLEAAAPLIAAAGRERIVRWLERRAGQQVPGVARDALLEAAEALEDRSDEKGQSR